MLVFLAWMLLAGGLRSSDVVAKPQEYAYDENTYDASTDANLHYDVEAKIEQKSRALTVHIGNAVSTDVMRFKRYPAPTAKTPSANEVQEIKGILKNLLSGHDFDPEESKINDEDIILSPWPTSALRITQEATSSTPDDMDASNEDLEATDTTIIDDNSTTIEEYTITTPDLNITTTTVDVLRTSTDAETKAEAELDVPALLDIIANLTYDYDSNLTLILNETLQKQFKIPTCRTPSTRYTASRAHTRTTTPATKIEYDEYSINGTGDHIATCFVCGLEDTGIPKYGMCGDAFASDFLPLVPLDASARGYLTRFRKYCKHMDVPNFHMPKEDRRAMWGRWTGGCAVRWTDLSGVYTQRTCRNKNRAVTGKHIASKRMAKLEMALKFVDNGCIVSPVASLLPLSRGISLYARFYACVCTGDFCNYASASRPWSLVVTTLPVLLTTYIMVFRN